MCSSACPSSLTGLGCVGQEVAIGASPVADLTHLKGMCVVRVVGSQCILGSHSSYSCSLNDKLFHIFSSPCMGFLKPEKVLGRMLWNPIHTGHFYTQINSLLFYCLPMQPLLTCLQHSCDTGNVFWELTFSC